MAGSINMIGLPTDSGAITYAETTTSAGFKYSDSETSSEYSRIYKHIVLRDGERYNLKMTVPKDKKTAWIVNRFKNNPFYWLGSGTMQAQYKWYITDDGGSPIEWTVYVAIWDIDDIEGIYIPKSAVNQNNLGEKVTRLDASKYASYNQYKGGKFSDGRTTVSYKTQAAVLNLTIPKDGLAINIHSGYDNNATGKVYFSMIKEIIQANSFLTGQPKWGDYE